MSETDMLRMEFEIHLSDEDLAHEMVSWIQDYGAPVERTEDRGILPLLPIVLAGIMAISGIGALIMWIRSKTRCQLLIDVRHEEIRKEIDCKIRDGRVIIVAKDNVRVEVIDAPAMLDFTEIMKSAVGGTSSNILAAIDGAGAKGRIAE